MQAGREVPLRSDPDTATVASNCRVPSVGSSMAKPAWYAHSTWTPAVREVFLVRLRAVTGAHEQAACLRKQAVHLAKAKTSETLTGARELYELLLAQFPDTSDLAYVHTALGEVLETSSELDAALTAYRAAIDAQRGTTRSTDAHLRFGAARHPSRTQRAFRRGPYPARVQPATAGLSLRPVPSLRHRSTLARPSRRDRSGGPERWQPPSIASAMPSLRSTCAWKIWRGSVWSRWQARRWRERGFTPASTPTRHRWHDSASVADHLKRGAQVHAQSLRLQLAWLSLTAWGGTNWKC